MNKYFVAKSLISFITNSNCIYIYIVLYTGNISTLNVGKVEKRC